MPKAPITNITFGAMTLYLVTPDNATPTESTLSAVQEVLAAIDDAALKAQPKWPPYFSGV
jgi:aflatoxin B1 aldehyde reductase